MPALQIKECPPNVYERLRACAAEENRSIAQQTLTIIQGFLDAREHASSGAPKHVPTRPLYSTGFDETDYLANRMRAFERIGSLPPLPIGPSSPPAADILAGIRAEEAR